MSKSLIQKVYNLFARLTPANYAYMYISIIILFAFMFFNFVEFNNSVEGFYDKMINSIYISTVTITTLGYGDFCPINNYGKILCSIEAIMGIFIIGLFLNSIAVKIESLLNIENILFNINKQLYNDISILIHDVIKSKSSLDVKSIEKVRSHDFLIDKLEDIVNINSHYIPKQIYDNIKKFILCASAGQHASCKYNFLKDLGENIIKDYKEYIFGM